MLNRMYALYDKKAQFFQKPFHAVNDETALRMIKNAFTQQDSQQAPFVVNPEDFSIHLIGTYDDNSGKVESDIQHITDILELVPANNVVDLNTAKAPEQANDNS